MRFCIAIICVFATMLAPHAAAVDPVPPPSLRSPLLPGGSQITIENILPEASTITVYRAQSGEFSVYFALAPATTPVLVVPVPPLVAGERFYVTQTVADIESEPSATVVVGVPAPTAVAPAAIGEWSLFVTDIHPSADELAVWDVERNLLLSTIAAPAWPAMNVPLEHPILPCQQLAATQTFGGATSPFSTTVGAPPATGSHVVINEFRHDDQGTDNEEFIELYNPNAFAAELSGWTLRQGGPNGDADAPDYAILLDIVIPAGGFYLLGPELLDPNQVIGSTNLLRNDRASLELVDTCGNVIDAVAWDLRSGSVPAASEFGIWGDLYSYTALHGATLSRWWDGYDTDDNRRDFGVRLPTPGWSNHSPTVNHLAIQSDVPGTTVATFFGQYRDAVFVDPTVTGPLVEGLDWNPFPVAAAPCGLTAASFWDPEGGSNNWHSVALVTGAAFDLHVYFDTGQLGTGAETWWTIGLSGSVINDGFNSSSGAQSGHTGILWEYRRTSTLNTLTLYDAANAGGRIAWRVIDSHTLTDAGPNATPSGWYRLGLAIDPGGTVEAVFDTGYIADTTDPNLVGGMHIVYEDNNFGGAPRAELRPPLLACDVDCDGNGIPDVADVLAGTDADCNANGTLDGCDGYVLIAGDFNRDGVVTSSDGPSLEACFSGPADSAIELSFCCAALELIVDGALDCYDVAALQVLVTE